jgi:D-sedoheptulose 7-phosphate isomerase
MEKFMSIFSYREDVLSPRKAFSTRDEYSASLTTALLKQQELLTTALDRLVARVDSLAEMALLLVQTLRGRKKVLIAGNGGSAAEAQHFAAELVGRFKRERLPYPVIALTTDTAILTALANDYGYVDVFARQVQAFGQPGDLLIVFSTSGESENLIRAVRAGKKHAMNIAAILGERQCRLERLADLAIRMPTVDTSAIQELHLVVIHLLCEIVEARLFAEENEQVGKRS